MSSLRRIACVHIPSFPIAVAVRAMAEAGEQPGERPGERPGGQSGGQPGGTEPAPPRERPLVLVGGAGGGARVREANGAAREAGIRPGVHTAARARTHAADLLVLPWDDGQLAQAQEELTARLLQHSPGVTCAGTGRFWLDASGQERLGGDRGLATRLVTALGEAGYVDARVAVAASVVAAEAAVYAAVHATGSGAGSGAGGGANSGQAPFVIVPPDPAPPPGHGVDARFLAPLPLALLPLPGDLREVLADLGLTRVGELAALPAASLEVRFGAPGLRARDLARGLDPRGPLCQGGPRARLVEVAVDPPADSLEPLVFAARGALVTLLRALAEDGTEIARLRIHLRLDGETRTVQRDAGLGRPTARLTPLTDRCRAVLESLTLEAPVIGLAVEILERAPGLRGDQGDLFEARFRDPEALEAALSRIRARCGSASVVRPVAVDSHQPEAAGRWQADPPLPGEEPLPEPPPALIPAPPGPAASAAQAEERLREPPLRRALRVPAPPPAVEVRCHPDGRPAAVRLGRRWHPVVATDPAVRRSGQWWRDEVWARQDHLVTTASGARLLLSAQPAGWQLLAWED